MKTATITFLLCACGALTSLAQTAAPSTEKMIEQLKTPRTRSLRNLQVEAVPAQAGASAAQDSGAPAQSPSAGALAVPATELAPGTGAVQGRPTLSLLIQFDFDSARVRPESQQALTNLSQALQSTELRGSKFAVEGHTDAKGSPAYNQRLSELRALAVRDFLKAQGVEEERLLAAGKGASELANSEQPFAAENRRVLIVNLD